MPNPARHRTPAADSGRIAVQVVAVRLLFGGGDARAMSGHMNFAEELIVAGLTGRPGPTVPGQQFAFVVYLDDGEWPVQVWGEGPTPFIAIKRAMQRNLASGVVQGWSDDPTRWPFFDTLPEEVRNSGDRDLIWFLIGLSEGYMARHGWFSFTTQSAYLDGHMEEFLPCARCVCAWDAEPPLQDAAFGLYSFEPVAFSPTWRTETVLALARQMCEREDFSALPVLADALQDAGCEDEQILNHCRDSLPAHDCGRCWAVDLVLDRGFVSEAEPGAAPDAAG
ncbi:hypothetical protein R5W23_005666 [Gemmata sp. JC673]|uniref:Uncharacterized protein n=1 Tax=Gemmata algarum TaxID=2975278 RepID=A0ABU5ET83_9BACT|nr:hypothetical protein [Gemmata algarum]MDY3558546.1 hypothetical protein [Gemmata algarum]